MIKKKKQGFFNLKEWWEDDWQDMPEFVQEDQSQFKSLIVNFKDKKDMEEFARLVGQRITFKTQSIWYPKAELAHFMNKKYIDSKEYKS